MDIKQRLKELHTIRLMINTFEAELAKDKQLYSFLPSALVEVEQAHLKRIEELQKQQETTLNLINKLNNPIYRALLIARYYDCKGWKEVASIAGYSLPNIYRLHKQALRYLEVIHGQETNYKTC